MLCHNPQSININKTIQHRCDLNIHLESANCAKRWHKYSRSNKPAMKLLWKNTEGAMPLSIIKIAHLQSYSEFFIMQTFHNPYQQLFPQVAVKVSLKKKRKKDFMAWFLQNHKKGISIVVQWLRIYLPMKGTWIQSLVRKLRSYLPPGS